MLTSDALKPPHNNWLRRPTTPIGVPLLHPTANTLKVTLKMGMAEMGVPHTKIPIRALIAHLEAQIILRNPIGSANTLQSVKSVMNWATLQNIVHICTLLSPLPIMLPLHLQQTQNGLLILEFHTTLLVI